MFAKRLDFGWYEFLARTPTSTRSDGGKRLELEPWR
jgi:hypothetical protein